MTNIPRAQRVRALLERYSSDPETRVRDFLADPAHYCDEQNLSLSEELAMASEHYHAEAKSPCQSFTQNLSNP